jgi:hypothetical protein
MFQLKFRIFFILSCFFASLFASEVEVKENLMVLLCDAFKSFKQDEPEKMLCVGGFAYLSMCFCRVIDDEKKQFLFNVEPSSASIMVAQYTIAQDVVEQYFSEECVKKHYYALPIFINGVMVVKLFVDNTDEEVRQAVADYILLTHTTQKAP